MNEYIKSLKDQNKLNISIDKSKTFDWKYTKIAENMESPDFWIFWGGFKAREASQRLPRACGINSV